MKKLFRLVVLLLLSPLVYASPFSVIVDDSQIQHGTVSNDIWSTPFLDAGEKKLDGLGDKYVIDIDLVGRVKIDDGFFNGDESIHMSVQGTTLGLLKFAYKFWFTDVEGDLQIGTASNPITGNASQVFSNGTFDLASDIDLIDGGSFSFSDIHMEIELTTSRSWTINQVSLGADGDEISTIPEPSSIALFSIVLFGLAVLVKRQS